MEDKTTISVCFTGHRRADISAATHALLLCQLKKLINDGFCDFYAGGSIGWDTICERAVIDLKTEGFEIRLHLILPCCFEEQTLGWTDGEKQEFINIQSRADTIEYISEHYTDNCMRQRNQKLVDNADMAICYFDSRRTRSGTGQTVRMAEKKGLRIWNFFSHKTKPIRLSPN